MVVPKAFQKIKIITILFLSFIFYLYLSQYGNQNGDINVHLDWAQSIFKHPLNDFYFRSKWRLTNPPTQPSLLNFLLYGSQYIYQHRYFLYQLHNLFKIPPTSVLLFLDQHCPYLSIKFWPILAVLVSSLFIYLTVKTRKNNQTGLLAMLFFLFNPLIIFQTSFWGQFDIVSALPATLSIFLIPSQPILSPILFTVSLLIKPTTAVLIPLYLTVYIKQHSINKKGLCAFLLSLSLVFLSFYPFKSGSQNLVQSTLEIFQHRIAPASKGTVRASVSAFNLYSLLFRIGLDNASQPLAGFIKINHLSFLLVLISQSLIIYHYLHRYQKTSIFTYIFLSSQSIFLLATGMLERYFLVSIIASTIILFNTKKRSIKRLILTHYLIAFINLFYAFYFRSSYRILNLFQSHNFLLIRFLSLFNLIIFLSLVKQLLKIPTSHLSFNQTSLNQHKIFR